MVELMLTQLLKTLNMGRTYSQHDLSQALQTNVDSIRAQIEFLERHGYLKRITISSCHGKTCAGCNGCGERNTPPVMWEINKVPN